MLTDFDKKVLRACTGEDVLGMVWGAAMSETVEHLCGLGYMEQVRGPGSIEYRITPAGRDALGDGRMSNTTERNE